MKLHSLFRLLWLASLCLRPTLTWAEPANETENWPDERKAAFFNPSIAIHGNVGLWTPLGFLGATAELALGDYLSAELGVGAGGAGQQRSGMLHTKVPLVTNPKGRVSLGLGIGLSSGLHAGSCPLDDGCRGGVSGFETHWKNVQGTLEVRKVNGHYGYVLRVFGGYGFETEGFDLPFFGFSAGLVLGGGS